jgi:hypothetical protein
MDNAMKALVVGLVFLCAIAPVAAQEDVADVPLPPTIPAPVQSGEILEPEVTIIESDKGTVYEYRVRGSLYMVKIQPAAGPPYYLLDLDGDGQMDVRQDEPWNNSIPQWVLFSW